MWDGLDVGQIILLQSRDILGGAVTKQSLSQIVTNRRHHGKSLNVNQRKKIFFLHPPSFDNVWLGEAGWGVGTDSPHPLTDISRYMFSLSFACITVSVFGKPPPPATVGAPRPDQLGIVSHRKDSHPKQF